jgi:hypothetical protein
MPPGSTASDEEQLLEHWRKQARTANVAHLRATDSMSRRGFGLGATTTILGAVVGTSVFASAQSNANFNTPFGYVLGSLSVLAAVLAALQTYLRYSERAEKHRKASRQYGDAVRDIEAVQKARLARTELDKQVQTVDGRLDLVDDPAPNVPPFIWAWAVWTCHLADPVPDFDPSSYGRGPWPRIRWAFVHRFPGQRKLPARRSHAG